MHVLIADSGATKTDWAYIHKGKPVYIKTSGLHPAYTDQHSILSELRNTLPHVPDAILFYGSGCYSDEVSMPIRRLMDQLFPSVPVEIFDDLTAVAHAFLNNRKGITGILGTGSNSGLFEKGRKRQSIPSLGYILGDEGSAADIGKRILRAALREEFSRETLQFLQSVLGPLNYQEVVSVMYETNRPSYYLAKISEKVLKGSYTDEITRVAEKSIQSFIDAHLKKYDEYKQVPVVLTGGVAVHHAKLVAGILKQNDIQDYRISGGIIASLAMRQIDKIKSI